MDAGDINPCPCPKANFQHLVPEDEKAEYDAPHNSTSDDLSSADFREVSNVSLRLLSAAAHIYPKNWV